ncbi:hypothetical protein ACOI1H_07740 [Loktanella sp. DJP18]|uniref:hypothetical protein n=1 Tax=Loktanella sp. DJP18 TaxID=3409788 RepID=UPI003BB66D68
MKRYTLSLSLILLAATSPGWAADDAYKAFVTEKVAVWMAKPLPQAALAAGNEAHAALTEEDVSGLDAQWRDQIAASDGALITQVLSGTTSDYLRQIVDESNGVIAEIILMDKRGLNAAVSVVTSDYWQGDEDKFQKTFGQGVGAIHVSAVELDESSGIYVVQVSVPVVSALGELVGAATFSLDAERL